MYRQGVSLPRVVLLLVVVAAVAVGLYFAFRAGPAPKPDVATTATAPAPKTKPKPPTKPAEADAPPRLGYVDVVRSVVPGYPATQPLALPLDLPQAAHLRLKAPVYLDGFRNLWVTHPDAPPLVRPGAAGPRPLGRRPPRDEAAKLAGTLERPYDPNDTEYVVPEPVLFVHWAANDDGELTPRIVVPAASGGGYEYVSARGRTPVPPGREYRWDLARGWFDRVVVPSATGVSVFRFEPKLTEAYQDLLNPGEPTTAPAGADAPAASGPVAAAPATRPAAAGKLPPPQVLFDGQGFLAWIPWENGAPGGRGAARYADDKWIVLGPANGWPERIIHLVPLLGGSVMQLAVGDAPDTVRLGVTASAAGSIDRATIEKLVGELSAGSPKVRDAAFQELARYGPAVRPVLKELLDEGLPPETEARASQLMRDQVRPLLGPMTLLGNKLRLVSRHRDGGAVFYAEAGVEIANPEGDPYSRVPAWLSVRPGKFVQVLPDAMIGDALPERAQVVAVEGHDDDWVVVSDARGPRRFVGNALVQLLRKDETEFTQLVGVDRRGRWLFRRPGRADETLVLDPTLPDLTPRLPVWNYATADEVGWDKDNWPAVRQGGRFSRLLEDRWDALASAEDVLTTGDQIPPPTTGPSASAGSTTAGPSTAPAKPATGPTTNPATAEATTRPASADDPAAGLGQPIGVAPDGTRYFGGEADLTVVTPDGRRAAWPLPDIATGKAPAHAIRTPDGRVFLFNQPGRVLRLKPTGTGSFEVEATFSRNVPSVDDPTRVWLDPAGRIVVAYDKQLAILFPSGYIPPRLRLMITNFDDEPQE